MCIILLLCLVLPEHASAVSKHAKEVWPRPHGTYLPFAKNNWSDHLAKGYNQFWKGNIDRAISEWTYEIKHNNYRILKRTNYNNVFRVTHALRALANLSYLHKSYFYLVSSLYQKTISLCKQKQYYADFGMFLYWHGRYKLAIRMMKRAVSMDSTNRLYKYNLHLIESALRSEESGNESSTPASKK